VRRRVFLLACCGSAGAQEQAAAIDLRIAGGLLPASQRRIGARKGDRVRWRVSSDAPGELHLHAYRLVAKVEPGKPVDLDFTAFATGRFPLSWHPHAARAAAHADAPLALLEVLPR
jgi:hypothetical protein